MDVLPNATGTALAERTGAETQRDHAVELLAQDDFPDWRIADFIGVHRDTISRWKRDPVFWGAVVQAQAKLGEAKAAMERDLCIARKRQRLAAKEDRWEKGYQLLRERAADPDMEGIPGGSTGLLVKTVVTRQNKDGSTTTRTTYRVDHALLKELRELEKSAALEMGQIPRAPLADGSLAPAGNLTNVQIINSSPAELESWRNRLTALVQRLGGNQETPPASSAGPST
jgi:hypothetical protein